MKGLFECRLLLKIENRKHCSKIIFKCVNSIMGPSFNENFAEKNTYESREQCTGPTIQKRIAGKQAKRDSQTGTKKSQSLNNSKSLDFFIKTK